MNQMCDQFSIIFFVFCIYWTTTQAVTVNGIESVLYTDLLSNYTKFVRPVKNSSHPVVVSLGVALQQIVDVDEKAQIVDLNAWLIYGWRDENLIWDPNNYEGIQDIRFPADRIWKPDILLYNSADSEFDTTYHSNLIVYSDGTINWIPPGIFRMSCKMDVTWFPFDDQTCYLKFGSWSYNGNALDLILLAEAVDTSEYLTNGEWQLLSAPAKREVKKYTTSPDPYPSVTFFLNIRRRSTYYVLNAILPCIIMSTMTVFGFWLPPECGERITIQMTVLLSVCFFMSVIAGLVPTTSETTPLIGAFFDCCMVIVSQSVVWTVIVLNLHYRPANTRILSGFPRKVLLYWLPRLLHMDSPVVEPFTFLRNAMSCAISQARGLAGPDHGNQRSRWAKLSKQNNNPKFISTDAQMIYKEMRSIQTALDEIGQQLHGIIEETEKKDKEDVSITEWKFAALVIDRLCITLFTICIAFGIAVCIYKVYYH